MRHISLREFRTRGARALQDVPPGETALLVGQNGPAYFLVPVVGDVVQEDRDLRRAMALLAAIRIILFRVPVVPHRLILRQGRIEVNSDSPGFRAVPAVAMSYFCAAIQSFTRCSSTSSGSAPESSTSSWNARISNFAPSAVFARCRSSRIFSCPILYASAWLGHAM
jgi:hypothetical protein